MAKDANVGKLPPALPAVFQVRLDALTEPARNPNRMRPEDYALLVDGIRRSGFLQPVLVRRLDDGTYEVVDGVHRCRAARDVGLDVVWAVEAPDDPVRCRLLQIALNRLRGELDMGEVARTVAELSASDVAVDELCAGGFTEAEVAELCRIGSGVDPDPLDAPAPGVGEEDEGPARPFVLELRFATADDHRRAKKGLRKAAGGGRGAQMEAGLLRLLDGA